MVMLLLLLCLLQQLSGFTRQTRFHTQLNGALFAQKYLVLVDPDPLDLYGIASQVEGGLFAKVNDLIQPKALYSPAFAKELLLKREELKLSEEDVSDICSSIYTDELYSDIEVCGVLCASDTGLAISELFAARVMSTRYNHKNIQNEARRDKYLQQCALQQHNIRSIRQVLTDSLQTALEFYDSLPSSEPSIDGNSKIAVVKPVRGSASTHVYKCNSTEELIIAFNKVLGKPGYANNTISDAILIQEFITGEEYVCDTVTLAPGEHKMVANWKYDKKCLNTKDFIYYATILVPSDETPLNFHEYVASVLNCMRIETGPAHIEVMYTNTGECVLIEANCGRFHLDDFVVLCNLVNGYNAIDVALDGILANIDIVSDNDSDRDRDYNENEKLREVKEAAQHRLAGIPSIPPTAIQCSYFGCILNLWSSVQGTLVTKPDPPTGISSLMKFVLRYDEVGDYVHKTIDLATDSGWAVMVNEDRNILQQEVEQVYKYQETMFDVM